MKNLVLENEEKKKYLKILTNEEIEERAVEVKINYRI